ncbi:MAG: aminoglycoside 6-adenylyltransferase [Pseudomonadales bacterium]|jgi:aminoglycoside 6-adenylyltransferase|nr:aminoglycoside 6-adenylyltransferase [Pseudomonadales bacterium]|tara:strand:- start:44 stop:925 length:882 start_codon:yes stop_codon:yes gene_type:complete
MKTRTEKEMLALIIGFANVDDRVRTVLMNGSRANPNVVKDPFQDYDVANFVTDVEPFRDEAYVLPHFGEAIVVEQPLIGPWPPADADGSYHNYNMQLVDGNRIDLSFFHVDTLNDRLTDSLTEVLLDKDGVIPSLPPANESSYFITEPTRQLYDGCCTGFFFALGSHIPKTIWRKNLPLLKFHTEAWLRESVVMMLGWEIGIRTGWEKSLGSKGKYLERHLAPDVWNEYKSTYVDSDYDRLWESLFLFYRIFKKSAEFVAERRGFYFPQEKAANVLAFLEHVRTLPADARRIY